MIPWNKNAYWGQGLTLDQMRIADCGIRNADATTPAMTFGLGSIWFAATRYKG